MSVDPGLYPPFIFGLHDPPKEHKNPMLQKGRLGWIVVTEGIGDDPTGPAGPDYRHLSDRGLGVIVRLNYGYGLAGTIPRSDRYRAFAKRCGNFAGGSRGCHIWIIGNETNLAAERPGGPERGEVITPQRYAECFRLCRDEIRSRPGHENDQVVVSAVGPWNNQTTYPENPSGNWVRYFADILHLLEGECDGIALHTYTKGHNLDLIAGDFYSWKSHPDADLHNLRDQFRCYVDFMGAIPHSMRHLPVYVTETDQDIKWHTDERIGWVQAAYAEIDRWNRDPSHQPIQALVLYRWSVAGMGQEKFSIVNRSGVRADFWAALDNDYRVRLPGAYRAEWQRMAKLSPMRVGETKKVTVRITNVGGRPWAATGDSQVGLGFRWFTPDGQTLVVDQPRIRLPHNVSPGNKVTLQNVEVKSPDEAGEYLLRWDLHVRGVGWLRDHGSPGGQASTTVEARVVIQVPEYKVGWLEVDVPTTITAGETIGAALRLANQGSKTWVHTGEHQFRLGYEWFAADGTKVEGEDIRTPLRGPVRHGREARLPRAEVKAPSEPGRYTLRFDMIEEGVCWFWWKGSPRPKVAVEVKAPAIPDYRVEWLEIDLPPRIRAGETLTPRLIQFKNAGGKTWLHTGEHQFRLGYEWFTEDGQKVEIEDIRTSLPHDVAPGQEVSFSSEPSEGIIGGTGSQAAALRAPPQEGRYVLRWDMIEEDVAWFWWHGSPRIDLPVEVLEAETRPPYRVTWLEIQRPARLTAGETVEVKLRLRNDGSKTWTNSGINQMRLGYEWFTAEGEQIGLPDLRTALPKEVRPGQEVTLTAAQLQAPPDPGNYVLRWDMIEEGIAWFWWHGSPREDISLEVVPAPARKPYAVEWLAPSQWPKQMSPVEQRTFDFKLRNAGTRDWLAGGPHPVHLAYAWFTPSGQWAGDWQTFRTPLPADVSPDEEVSLPGVVLRAPSVTGDYVLRWELVEEGVTWFSQQDAEPLEVRLKVKPEVAHKPWKGRASQQAGAVARAFDGNPDTFWGDQVLQAAGVWFELNLGERLTVDRVRVESPGRGFPFSFDVQVAADRRTWKTVYHLDRNWKAIDAIFSPSRAQYVRVILTGAPDWQTNWFISEWAVSKAPRLWVRGRASHNAAHARRAIDGNVTTAWSTLEVQQPGMWYTLDMGRAQRIEGLRLDSLADQIPRGYVVEVSTDDQAWREVAEGPDNWAPLNETFEPVEARYVRVRLTNSSRWHPWSIAAFAVRRASPVWLRGG
jgi:hypothetical protein